MIDKRAVPLTPAGLAPDRSTITPNFYPVPAGSEGVAGLPRAAGERGRAQHPPGKLILSSVSAISVSPIFSAFSVSPIW